MVKEETKYGLSELGLEGLVYAVAYDLSHNEDEVKYQVIGVMYHTDLKDKPRIIGITPKPITALVWSPNNKLYYACNKMVREYSSNDTQYNPVVDETKSLIYSLAWVPNYGLVGATQDGRITLMEDKEGKYHNTLIAKRPKPVLSLAWVPGRGLFDAGMDPPYNQIRRCLDKDCNTIDELLTERGMDTIPSVPTLQWVPNIGLLDNGQIEGLPHVQFWTNPTKLVRYLEEHGDKCCDYLTENLAEKKGKLQYVKSRMYTTCRLHRDYTPLIFRGGFNAIASMPDGRLLYAPRGNTGIFNLLDKDGKVVQDKVIRTYPNRVTAMTYINKEK